ncbi:hypothetical protein ACFPRL_13585 [Pseudoclavibacter helvolus]
MRSGVTSQNLGRIRVTHSARHSTTQTSSSRVRGRVGCSGRSSPSRGCSGPARGSCS